MGPKLVTCGILRRETGTTNKPGTFYSLLCERKLRGNVSVKRGANYAQGLLIKLVTKKLLNNISSFYLRKVAKLQSGSASRTRTSGSFRGGSSKSERR